MHAPKLLIIVRRTHWHCISCKIVSNNSMSIDHHLRIHHSLHLSSSRSSVSASVRDLHIGGYSDGELDVHNCLYGSASVSNLLQSDVLDVDNFIQIPLARLRNDFDKTPEVNDDQTPRNNSRNSLSDRVEITDFQDKSDGEENTDSYNCETDIDDNIAQAQSDNKLKKTANRCSRFKQHTKLKKDRVVRVSSTTPMTGSSPSIKADKNCMLYTESVSTSNLEKIKPFQKSKIKHVDDSNDEDESSSVNRKRKKRSESKPRRKSTGESVVAKLKPLVKQLPEKRVTTTLDGSKNAPEDCIYKVSRKLDRARKQPCMTGPNMGSPTKRLLNRFTGSTLDTPLMIEPAKRTIQLSEIEQKKLIENFVTSNPVNLNDIPSRSLEQEKNTMGKMNNNQAVDSTNEIKPIHDVLVKNGGIEPYSNIASVEICGLTDVIELETDQNRTLLTPASTVLSQTQTHCVADNYSQTTTFVHPLRADRTTSSGGTESTQFQQFSCNVLSGSLKPLTVTGFSHSNVTPLLDSGSGGDVQPSPLERTFDSNYTGENTGEWIKRTIKFDFDNAKKPTLVFESLSTTFECTICQAKFSSGSQLSNHAIMVTDSSPLQCKMCQKTFHSTYDINLHVFGEHERKKIPFCFKCGEQFQAMELFEVHLYRHAHNSDPKFLDLEFHTCHICGADMQCRFANLYKHYYHKHKVPPCFECFVRSKLVVLTNLADLQEHRLTHAEFCEICLKDFPSADSFKAHLVNHPPAQFPEDGRGQVCERCNQWCPNMAAREIHLKHHKLQIQRTWREKNWSVGIQCMHCDKVLRNKRNLQRHIEQLHSPSKTFHFHCEFCAKGVNSRNALKDHIAHVHMGIKRYTCKFCQERFASAPTLRRHVLKKHDSDKQYTCPHCDKKFCEKSVLNRHISVHTGLSRFMCEACGKGFQTPAEFRKHMSVHSDKREFFCPGCGRGYKRPEHLKRHTAHCTK